MLHLRSRVYFDPKAVLERGDWEREEAGAGWGDKIGERGKRKGGGGGGVENCGVSAKRHEKSWVRQPATKLGGGRGGPDKGGGGYGGWGGVGGERTQREV